MKSNFYLCIILAAFLCGQWLQAFAARPPITITGNVIDEKDGSVLPGVTVALKGSNLRAITDRRGNYSINVPDTKAILVFSFVGYQSQEIPVNTQTIIYVKLTSTRSELDEVVVVGYGTRQRRDLTESVASLKSEDIEKYNSATFQTAMMGRMAGVEMNESTGVPGAAVNIRIRGLSTINGSAGPLYIVDGIPIISGTGGDGDGVLTNGAATGVESNPLSDINPNDIASVEVLKDAAATAIYGARGGSGVILITTKRAKKGQSQFSLRLTGGYSHISKSPSLLNGPQFLGILDEAYANTFRSVPANAGLPVPATPLTTGLIGFDRGMADTTNQSHLHDVLRDALYQEINLTASNGTDKTRFYISGMVRTSAATFRGNDLNQFSVRLNVDHEFNRNIKFGGSLAPSYSTEWRLGSGSAFTVGGYSAAVTANLPIYPTYNADGTYFNPWNNSTAFLNRSLYYNRNKRLNVLGSAYLTLTLAPGLTSQTNVQRQDFNQTAYGYTDGQLRITTGGATVSPFPTDPIARITQQNNFGYINSLESYFTYTKKLGKNHSFNTVMGMRFSATDILYEAIYGENFPNTKQQYPSQAANVEAGFQTGAQGDPSANLGYFFRMNYKFKERYLLGFTVNRDGSSRFGGNQRYGTFPALSAGWIVSDEKFLHQSKLLSFLKLRGSAGLTGSAQGISNTAAKSTFANTLAGVGTYKNDPGNMPNSPADAELHWEKGVKYAAGVDFGLFKNRVNATFDWYHYITRELLLSIPTPFSFGYANPATNLTYLENRGSLINRGVEFSVNSVNLSGNFRWNTSFNISHNTTYIQSLGGLTPDQLSAGGGNTLLFEGHNGPVYSLIQWMGVDPATGAELVMDKNGNTVAARTLNAQALSDARRPQFNKPAVPLFYGGIGNNFSYRGFNLSVFFAYRYGNYMIDAGQRLRSYVGNYSFANSGNTIVLGNLSSDVLNRWTTPGQVTDVPKLYYNDPANDVLRGLNTTRFLSDASFIRLKNVELAYTLPQRWVQKLRVRSATVNITGQNLLLWTRFKGTDPEAQNIVVANRERNLAFGITNNALPLPVTLTAGLNINF